MHHFVVFVDSVYSSREYRFFSVLCNKAMMNEINFPVFFAFFIVIKYDIWV